MLTAEALAAEALAASSARQYLQPMKTLSRGPVRAALVLVAAIVVLAAGPWRVTAQGGAEPAVSDRGPIPAIIGMELTAAVELARQTSGDWEYDPGSRHVFAEDAEIDYPLVLSDAEWQRLLDPEAYRILRQKGTERAFSHPLNDNEQPGVYYSRATGQPLFSSSDKFDSRTGWPSFTRPINPDAIVYIEDNSLFSRRIEVVDSLSGSHLGHVFPDGPAPTYQRYCINGEALVFVPDGGEPPPIRTGS